MHVVKTFLFFVISSLLTISAMGQTVTAKMGAEMIGSWLVEVEGSSRDRALIVINVSEKSQNSLSLEGKFGWSGTEQPLSVAEIDTATKELKLVAKSGAKVVATQIANGSFVGKFFDRNDQAREVKITKAAENELQTRRDSLRSGLLTIEKPTAEVPESCGKFFGGWAGTWSIAQGPQRLWVVAIKNDCTVKYSYRTTETSEAPTLFRSGEIKQGVLSIPCGNDGTCVFERKGDEIWGRYSNSSGGSNNGTFKKISSH